jgi:hypothetical protein
MFSDPLPLVCYETKIQQYEESARQIDDNSSEDQRENDIDLRDQPLDAPFDLNGRDTQVFQPDEWHDEKDTAENELLRIHQSLSHVSMERIQAMAKQGQFTPRIATCQIPMCQSCTYGKSTKRPWKTKSKTHNAIGGDKITSPGQLVSVDQLESSVLGFIGQMKGIPTTKRYRVATVFVDHFSNLGFVHLQTSTSCEETLQAKREFELYANSYGVQIQQYHADNGRFADSLWREDILKQGQRLTFSGVGAHHQNGKAEKKIRDTQELARTSLIHASRRWPDAVNAHL